MGGPNETNPRHEFIGEITSTGCFTERHKSLGEIKERRIGNAK